MIRTVTTDDRLATVDQRIGELLSALLLALGLRAVIRTRRRAVSLFKRGGDNA